MDRAPSKPARYELLVRDDAELTRGDGGDGPIRLRPNRCRTFFSTVMKILRHRASVAGWVLRVGAVCYGLAQPLCSAAGAVRAPAAFQGADLGGRLAACFVGHQLFEFG